MNQVSQEPVQKPIQRELSQARYVYCIGQFNGKQINCRGIEGSPVKIVGAEELCALVHDCKPEPYTTQDSEKAKEWIIQHQEVVDRAEQEIGTVIPFTFDTIFKEESQLIEFLRLNNKKIKEKLKQLEGKREFGIKIFYDDILQKQIEKEKTEQIEAAKRESRGKAYFLKKRVEREIASELNEKLKEYFKQFFEKISGFGEIIVENIKEKNMLAKFSCLVTINKIEELKITLDEINNLPFRVKFTGPWPPYSFAQKLFEEKNDN